MSRIDDLISEFCPKGVEHKALGEVGEFTRGGGLQKSDLRDEGFPAIHYGQIHTTYGISTKATKSFVEPELGEKLRRAKPGDLIIVTTSEDDEAVAKATTWLGEGEVAVSGDAFVFSHSLEPCFVAYFFQSRDFQSQKIRHITGAKVRRISGEAMAKIRVPVPPLEVQREIVRVLDLFTQLEAELEAELEARRQQYEHYRDDLLSLSGVEYKALGDIAELVRGNGMPKTDLIDAGVGAIHYGQIYTKYGSSTRFTHSFVSPDKAVKLAKVYPGDVIITNTSENLEDVCKAVAWLGAEQIVTGGHATVIKHNMVSKFLSYWLQSTCFYDQKKRLATGAKVIDVSARQLAKVKVPIPSLEEQERIVGILDKFDALVNDLSVGLPAELQARRKQYEYYRDKLLTFEEKKA